MFLGWGLNPLPKNFAVNCQLSTVKHMSITIFGYNLSAAIYESVNTIIYRDTKDIDRTSAIIQTFKAEHPTMGLLGLRCKLYNIAILNHYPYREHKCDLPKIHL